MPRPVVTSPRTRIPKQVATSPAFSIYQKLGGEGLCEVLTFPLYNIYIRFVSKLYRQIVVFFLWILTVPLL